MANFAQDLTTGSYHWVGTLFASSTGVTTSADCAGVSVDIAEDVGCMVTAGLIVGGRSGTSPEANMKMQESTTGTGSWTDCTGGAFAAQTTSNSMQLISYLATKQYQRCTGTIAGTTPVFPMHVFIVAPRRINPDSGGGFNNTAAAQ